MQLNYSHKDGTIKIAAHEVKDKIYLDITDEGVGIKASDIDHIFRRFYRAETDRAQKAKRLTAMGWGFLLQKK